MTANPTQPTFQTDPVYPGVYFGPEIELGEGGCFDPGTYIGYATGRKLDDRRLYLGEGALVRFGSTLYQGSRIGARLQTGHGVVIREQNLIGDDFSLWNNSTVDYGCTIGNHVKVHSNCYVAQYTVLEDDVFLAPGVTIANDPHPGCEFSQKCMRGPTIKRGAQIGANTTILPFVTIGEGAVIGSGSLVSRDVPPFTVAYGNPARPNRSVYDLECLTGDTDRPYHK